MSLSSISRTRSWGESIAQPALVDFEQSQNLKTGDVVEHLGGIKGARRLRDNDWNNKTSASGPFVHFPQMVVRQLDQREMRLIVK